MNWAHRSFHSLQLVESEGKRERERWKERMRCCQEEEEQKKRERRGRLVREMGRGKRAENDKRSIIDCSRRTKTRQVTVLVSVVSPFPCLFEAAVRPQRLVKGSRAWRFAIPSTFDLLTFCVFDPAIIAGREGRKGGDEGRLGGVADCAATLLRSFPSRRRVVSLLVSMLFAESGVNERE